MPQARGSQAAFALDTETTYGADPGAPDARKVYLKSCTLGSSQNLLDSETLGGGRSRTRPDAGNIDAAGDAVMEMSAEDMGPLVRHALGAVNTTGVGPYSHVCSISDLPVGMVFQKDFGAAITARFEKFNGLRVASAKFSFPQEGYPEATFSFKGANAGLSAVDYDATPTDYGHTSFSAFSAAIEEGGVSIGTVKSAEINVNNDLDEDGYTIGSNGVRSQLPEGFATVTGSVTVLFDSDALLTKAIAGTASSLKITLSRGTGLGSAGNESIEYLVQQLLFERQSPPIEGPKGVLMTLGFKGYRAGTDNGLLITIKNAVPTI